MADRQAQVPGGSYFNDLAESALYQRQVPGAMMMNETQLQEAGGGPFQIGDDDGDVFLITQAAI